MPWKKPMLSPDDRITLLDSLRPPSGYQLDLAVGATYSLRLDVALLVPAVLAATDSDQDAHGREPIGLLAALKRLPDRITIFHQAGQIAPERRARPVLACLEPSIHPVVMPFDRDAEFRPVFHPKFWVLRFVPVDSDVAEQGEPVHRILCASRNLTWDRSWDTLVRLDSNPGSPKRRSVDVTELADSLRALPDLAAGGVTPTRSAAIRELADDIEHVRWPAPPGFDGGRFHAFGMIPRRRDLPFPSRADRMVVVSPFLRPGLLARLPKAESATIISRDAELAEAFQAIGDLFQTAYTLDGRAVPATHSDDEIPFDGVHAKAFVFDVGEVAHVFTGSANATNAAFAGNAELLVQLDGDRAEVGVEAMLRQGEGENLALVDFLVRVNLETIAPHEIESEVDAARRDIERLRRSIGTVRVTAHVEALGDRRWQVTYRSTDPVEIAERARWRCWPVSLPQHDAQRVTNRKRLEASFTVGETEISAFLVHEVAIGDQVESFITKAELIGAPEGRIDRVLVRMVADVDRLMKLIELLLGDDGGFGAVDGDEDPLGGASGGATQARSSIPLLERLVRALGPHPERIIEVFDLLERVESDPELASTAGAPELARLRHVIEPIAAAARRAR